MKGKSLIVLLAIAGGMIGWVTSDGAGAVDIVNPSLASRQASGVRQIPVHVSGSVVTPGVVWLAEGSLVADAIGLAGGALSDADLNGINLAEPVTEGDQISVPSMTEYGGRAPVEADDGLIDINQADAIQLQTLPGVGPVLAERIIAQRDAVGRFEAVEDLLDVPGIGETRLASIRDLIRPP